MGQDQHICFLQAAASGGRCARRRVCLRKGCGCVFQPARWNQRYCQSPECLQLVRRWQAAKRQRQRRQHAAHRERHRVAERERRKRLREQAANDKPKSSASSPADEAAQPGAKDDLMDGAWSRSKRFPEDFCDRPGCYDPVRCSCRARARYCGEECVLVMRRVVDRERKWIRRNTYAGRFKRQLEYQQARRRRACGAASVAPS